MGVVFKARDRETGEIVALKVLKPEIAADRVSAERFLNEVRLSRRITHKNVTRVYEFSRAGATAYLSMEYVEGESLRSIVDRVGAVNVRKGIQIARQICAALHEAHAQGIVHRDLKPENVMLDKAGNVKVMDFGIARLLDASVTATSGSIIGTPAYMAPEQAEGRDVDGRTDIYATGLILYEIFTGRVAFTGDTPMVVALKQIRETPAAPRTIEPALPWELDAIIMRCLEKDPAQRFGSIEDLDAALAAVQLGGTGELGRPPIAGPAAVHNDSTWPTVAEGRPTPLASRTAPAVEAPVPAPAPAARRRRRGRGVGVVIAVLAGLWLTQQNRTHDAIEFERFRLDNGLEVQLAPDDSVPTIAVAVTYDVGAKDDPPGREGLAHLFEHLFFTGSLNVGRGEHHFLVTTQGGAPNGQAFIDHTQVWATLPANQLELALFLEADRMRSLRLDQGRLEAERGTVIAERQQRMDNQPYGRAQEALYNLAFDRPVYRKSALGSDAGLQRITLQEANDFFRIFYAPSNAVLSITGDFDPETARALVEKYFQHIPAQPPAPDIALDESPQSGERRGRVEDPFAPGPRTYIGYKIPPGTSDDIEALMVLSAVLGEGASSRLHQSLVRDREVATAIGSSLEVRKGPGLLTIVAAPGQNRDEAAVLAALDEEITRLRDDGISEEDVRRARTRLRLARTMQLQQSAQRALLLGEYETRFGEAALVNRRLRRLAVVSAADVRRAARTYLVPDHRSILSVVRGAAAAPAFKSTSASTTSSAGIERLDRAPVSKDVLRVTLPATTETVLDNGLTVLAAEDRRVPLVSVRMEFRGAGSRVAPPDNPAVAILAAAMMREGTPARSSRQIAEALDAHGVTISWSQTDDGAGMSVVATGLADTFEDWFAVLGDMVRNPAFPGDELSVLKRRFVADWQNRRAQPLTIASEALDQALYGPDVRLRIPVEAFTRVTAEQARAWHQERYVPQTAIVSIAGAIDRDDAIDTVRETLGGWARTSFQEPAPAPAVPSGARVFIYDRPGAPLTTLMAAVRTPGHADPDHLPLAVANRLLGGSPASRLFASLRTERGLTFSTGSVLSSYKNGGDWRTYADLRSDRADEGVDAFFDELRRLTAEPTSVAELDDARRGLIASFALTLEQLDQIVAYIGARRAWGLSADYYERFPEKLMAVTAEDLQRAVARYMDLSTLQVVAVGDAATLETLLSPLGQVTVVR